MAGSLYPPLRVATATVALSKLLLMRGIRIPCEWSGNEKRKTPKGAP